MYIDPINQRVFANELNHHGVKGMKWGVRKKYVSTGTTGRTASQKINSVITSSKGAHRRGEGLHGRKVSYDSYPASVENGAIVSSGNMTEKELVELHNKTIDEIRKSPYYDEIFKLAEDIKKLKESRSKNWNQNGITGSMVLDAKADKIVNQINEKLKSINDTYAEETAKIKNFKRDFSPAKWVLSDLSSRPTISTGLKLDKANGKVSKSWSSTNAVSDNSKGYKFEKKR